MRQSRRDAPFALVHFVAFAAVAALPLWRWPLGGSHGDVFLYHAWSTALAQGALPYLDVRVEYPPVALGVFLLPHVVALGAPLSVAAYAALFLVLNASLSTLIAVRLVRFAEERKGMDPLQVFATYTLLTLLVAPVVAWRFDLFPTACAVLGVLSAIDRRAFRSGAWVALGIACKLFPLVLAPLVGAWYVARRESRELSRFTLGVGLTLFACLAPVAFLAGEQMLYFVDYHHHRGLQIESVAAGGLNFATLFAGIGGPVQVVAEFGAWHLDGPVPDRVARTLPALGMVVLGGWLLGSALRFRRSGHADADSLLLASAGMLLGLLATSKVLSPQYAIWVIPFLAVVPGATLAKLTFAACTGLLYPFAYGFLLRQQLVGLLLLNLRNGALIWLLLALAWRYLPPMPARYDRGMRPGTTPC